MIIWLLVWKLNSFNISYRIRRRQLSRESLCCVVTFVCCAITVILKITTTDNCHGCDINKIKHELLLSPDHQHWLRGVWLRQDDGHLLPAKDLSLVLGVLQAPVCLPLPGAVTGGQTGVQSWQSDAAGCRLQVRWGKQLFILSSWV